MPTDTPVPTVTLTPTPVPYDLAMFVADAEGNPIASADVALLETGETLASDDAGQITWSDLPGESVTVSVTAQGYRPAEATATLERGPNEMTVALERDPFGLLPGEACAPGETLAYVEDFQDRPAPEFAAIDFQTAGWTFTDDPGAAGDVTAVLSSPEHYIEMIQPPAGQEMVLDDAVWRLRFMITGAGRQVSLNWRWAPEPYQIDQGEVNNSRY